MIDDTTREPTVRAPGSRTAVDPGSFRDPSGFVFRRDGVVHRQVNRSFAARWNDLATSGLLDSLHGKNLLIPHAFAPLDVALRPDVAHAVIRPEPLDFVSYPYE